MCMYVCMHTCVWVQKLEECVKSPTARVKGSCELPSLDAGSSIQLQTSVRTASDLNH